MAADSEQKVNEHFSRNPLGYAESYRPDTAEGHSFLTREHRLLEMLGNGTGRVLDIGCGPAVMTKDIQSLGWQYDGIDISEAMITEAGRRAPEAAFSVGTVNHIDAPDNTYDAVVAMGLVEYVEDDAQALREMQRVLKPGGRVFVSLPNKASPARLWDQIVILPLAALRRSLGGKSKPNVYHREYLLGSYAALAKSIGLAETHAVYYNFRILPRPFDYWFGSLSAAVSRKLEFLRNTPLRFLGTGIIVSAQKKNRY